MTSSLRLQTHPDQAASEAEGSEMSIAHAILSAVGDGFLSLDRNWCFDYVNPGAESLIGRSASKLLGKSLWEEFPHLVGTPTEDTYRRAIESGQTATFDYYSEAQEKLFAVRAIPSKPGGLYVAFSDVTRERSFEESNRRLAAIVESSHDAIISKDLHGVIKSWNRGAERIFGYTSEEVIGKSITILIPKNVHNEEPAIIERIRRGERVDHYETVRQRKDGSLVDVSLTVSPVRDRSGRVIGASKVARDISERLNGEAALRREHEALAELDSRKNEFLAMMGHELRNPLAAMQNAAELLVHGLDPEASQWAAGVIYRQTRQLGRLVNDLVDVARIMRGHFELHRSKVEISKLVSAVVETTRPVINERKHSLCVSISPEPAWVWVDPSRIEQLLVNVISNAVKYTEPGGVITVEVSHDSGTVSVRVADTGIGIPPKLLPHIFELFVQEAPGLDRSAGGLGIGLAVAKRLAEIHHGTLTAHSEGRGKGSSFELRLPMVSEMGSWDGDSAQTPTQGSAGKTGNRRVLLVDDNVDSAQTLARLLQLKGHEVHLAHDGIDALGVARKVPIDVFLLDLGLPHMDGYELIERLRSSRGSGVLYVAVSGFALPHDMERSKAAGFHYHLPKPVEIEPLLELIKTSQACGVD